jgi:hypothetical protein
MKKISKIFVMCSIVTVMLVGCQPKNTLESKEKEVVKKDIKKIEKPAKLKISENEIAFLNQEKANEKISEVQEKILPEAIGAVVETQNAIKLLTNKTKEKAIKQLQSALDKIEKVNTRFTEIELLPINIGVSQNVLITDLNTITQITKDAEKALKNKQLQEARELLSGLSSEIDITTVNIPLVTYPDAIKETIKLIDKNRLDAAKYNLIATLNNLVIVKDIIPVPVLNAEVFTDEASRLQLEDSKDNKGEILKLLDNAAYQLKLAEVLGYGKKDKTYKLLINDIKSIKKAVKSNSELKILLSEFKTKLKNFRNKVF